MIQQQCPKCHRHSECFTQGVCPFCGHHSSLMDLIGPWLMGAVVVGFIGYVVWEVLK